MRLTITEPATPLAAREIVQKFITTPRSRRKNMSDAVSGTTHSAGPETKPISSQAASSLGSDIALPTQNSRYKIKHKGKYIDRSTAILYSYGHPYKVRHPLHESHSEKKYEAFVMACWKAAIPVGARVPGSAGLGGLTPNRSIAISTRVTEGPTLRNIAKKSAALARPAR